MASVTCVIIKPIRLRFSSILIKKQNFFLLLAEMGITRLRMPASLRILINLEVLLRIEPDSQINISRLLP